MQYGYLYKCIAAFASNWNHDSGHVGEYVYSIEGMDTEDVED